MTVAIAQWGHSAALRIPKDVLRQMAVTVGDKVDMTVSNGKLVIKPTKPDLNELLAKVTPDNRHDEYLSDQIGNELL